MIPQIETTGDVDDDTLRQTLTKAFFALTAHWELTRQEEAKLLGWEYGEKRTAIDALRKGKTFLSKDRDKIERVIDLVNIHKSLRVLFPYDRDAVYGWVKVKRDRFGGHSALEVMLDDGKWGIAAIRQYLEHERKR